MLDLPRWDDAWILARRPPRADHDPFRPHGWQLEPERNRHGRVEDTATVFLTNRECPFRCLMCDLWQYATPDKVPPAAIPAQLDLALPHVRHAALLKLYNAGNFFDAQAIPTGDLPRIAEQVADFPAVLLECHPLLVGPRCLAFRDRLRGEMQMAMGLETIHPEVLPRLNKRMTTADFARAARFLADEAIPVRAFVLLRPPLLDELEGLAWAKASLEWAFEHRVECCVLIPTRAGNGAMDELHRQGLFHPPTLASLEDALAHGIRLGAGRVFADLWDIDRLLICQRCGPARRERLLRMNLEQVVLPPVACDCEAVA